MAYNFPKAIARYSRIKEEAVLRMYEHKMTNEPIDEDLQTIQFADIMLKMIRVKRRQNNKRERLRRRENENLQS